MNLRTLAAAMLVTASAASGEERPKVALWAVNTDTGSEGAWAMATSPGACSELAKGMNSYAQTPPVVPMVFFCREWPRDAKPKVRA